MKFLKFLMCVALTLLSQIDAKAESDYYTTEFKKGNTYYQDGQYDSALTIYNGILAAGKYSGNLMFNLGNTHYKLGNIPYAILYFERALKIDPSHQDAQFNLAVAEEQITDKVESLPNGVMATIKLKVHTLFHPNDWVYLSWAIGLLVLLSTLGLKLLPKANLKKLAFLSMLVHMVLWIFVLLGSRWSHYARVNNDFAVITEPALNIKSEPSENATDLFVIHEGLKVKVLDNQGDWAKIQLADGKQGWLRTNFFESI